MDGKEAQEVQDMLVNLVNENERLASENERLKGENEKLTFENERLKGENSAKQEAFAESGFPESAFAEPEPDQVSCPCGFYVYKRWETPPWCSCYRKGSVDDMTTGTSLKRPPSPIYCPESPTKAAKNTGPSDWSE